VTRRRRERKALQELQRKVWGVATYERHVAARGGAERRARMSFVVMGLGAVLVLLGIMPSAGATKPSPEHKITLCHRTDSYTNPYVVITVDIASVQFEGHDGHNGPVFFPSIPKHQKWGDIIPPFNFGPGHVYAGKNWTSAGQAVFDNGCASVTVPPPSTAPKTTTTCPKTTTTGPYTTTTAPNGTTSTTAPGGSTTTTTAPSTTTSGPGSTTTTSVPSTVTTAGGPETTTTTAPPGATSTAAGVTTTTSQFSGALASTGSKAYPLTLLGLACIASGFGMFVRRRRVLSERG
jgi:LPXTG-motif cell wall-anchored protein